MHNGRIFREWPESAGEGWGIWTKHGGGSGWNLKRGGPCPS